MQKLLISVLLTCITCVVLAQSKPTTHEVAKGETMYSISKRYHVTVEALLKANKSVGENFKLEVGQELIIPAGDSRSATSDTKPEKPTAPPTKALRSAAKPEPATMTSSAEGITHIVVKGETAYHISKEYGITLKQLKDANNLPDDLTLKLGRKLIIPSQNKEAMYKPEPVLSGEPKPVPKPKTVAATEQGKDYLTAQPTPIAKKVPETAKQEVIPPITATQPKTEQAPSKAEKPVPTHSDENPFDRPAAPIKATVVPPPPASDMVKNENVAPSEYDKVFSQYNESGKKKVVYRGIGVFMQSDNPGNQYLALYNYADMGSILKVTNLMSKESIYVKVIGKVPASDNEKDVILKVSSDAAKKLKVNEDKFLVEVTGYSGQ